jgi:hypothetical protein
MIASTWRLVFTDGAHCLLVHADATDQTEAETTARRKIERDYRVVDALRLRSAERIQE